MPERLLPPDFNLFRYSDRIGGHIYKGTEKDSEGHYGGNLGKDGLRFHSTDERATRIFKRHYGKELVKEYAPALVVPEIRVYLPYREAYHNYVAGYGEYSKGGLQRFCDGRTIKLRREKTQYTPAGGKPRDSWAVKEVDEPCPAADSPHPCEDCAYVRRLTVYIAELYDEGYRSAFVINSPAINEVGLFNKLADEERRLERFAPGSNVSYMPNSFASMPDTNCYIRWILKRSPEMIGVPAMKKDPKSKRYVPTGEQTQKEEWLLDLEIDPTWWDTAMSRVGKGPYRLDRATGQAICIEDERLRYYERLATAAGTLAAASQQASHFLASPGQSYALPPAIVVDAIEVEPGPGVPLNGDEPVPEAVAQALNVDGAPFRPSTNDPTNSNRLMAIASALKLTMDDIKVAMSLYEGRRSDELAEVHMQNVTDRLLLLWACQQKNAEGKPLFDSIEEAQSFMDSHNRQPKREAARLAWWQQVVQKQVETHEP